MKVDYIVFTDGSSKIHNDIRYTAGAAVLINLDDMNYVTFKFDLGGRTIRYAESYSIMKSISEIARIIKTKEKKVLIITDSQYDVDVYEKYIQTWSSRGIDCTWVGSSGAEVKNQDIFKRSLITMRSHPNIKYTFAHIRSHIKDSDWKKIEERLHRFGVKGNEQSIHTIMAMNALADTLANDKVDAMIKINSNHSVPRLQWRS